MTERCARIELWLKRETGIRNDASAEAHGSDAPDIPERPTLRYFLLVTEAAWWTLGDHPQRLYGVFEGGGVKGVAYEGALDAVASAGYWFEGVAGSSAGALTATLVAAGLTPRMIGDATASLLATVRVPGRLAGARRLRRIGWNETCLYDVTALRQELELTLGHALERFSSGADEREPTFSSLFAATGIDLYVVAIDVFMRKEIVFSHVLTPECQVVDAVMASCGIPIALPTGRLSVNRDGLTLQHPIMDGGVWSNLPDFVFRDPSFRGFHGLPKLREGVRVVPFVLDETGNLAVSERQAIWRTPTDSRF